MTIQNESDREAVIVSASTPAARTVELHEMRDEDGRMKMRKVDRVVVAAHGRVDLRPGGLHIMLFELTGPLVARTTVPFTLTLADGRSVEVEATVRGLGGSE
jgi:copper(I)-binding protein